MGFASARRKIYISYIFWLLNLDLVISHLLFIQFNKRLIISIRYLISYVA